MNNNALDTLAQLGLDIILRKTSVVWVCEVSGLCWLRGRFETSLSGIGKTPEQAAQGLLLQIAQPKDGYTAHILKGDGTYLPLMVLSLSEES